MHIRSLFLPAVICVSTVLSSCAAAVPPWSKSGSSDTETQREWLSCRRYAEGISGGRRYVDSTSSATHALDIQDRSNAMKHYTEILEACMQAKGYEHSKRR
ncbi:hypothetical protein AY555_01845 [Haematospirillum jordaniae]|uniref:Lipoprotein n=1 Tax=Haematospirillum jordaniae TaxID=1549855 RepID=A0A143DBJ9_9PROT|nr:hypothetical protein AY555_01845 [Haematospirillum jordaniae]